MEITPVGYLIIPASLLIFLIKPKYLLPMVVVFSIFPSMTVLNITDGFIFGLSPYYWIGFLLAQRTFLMFLVGSAFRLPMSTKTSLLVGLAFVLWSFASAFVLPNIFQGTPVYVPRLGIDEQLDNLSPLVWSFSNFGQAVYLLINFGVVMAASLKIKNAVEYMMLVRSFFLTSAIFGVFALYQVVSRSLGFYYPSNLLYSNPSHSIGFEQVIAGVYRVNATFSEPSYAGMYLSGVLGSGLYIWLVARQKWAGWLTLWVTVCLLLTTSSTAYLLLPTMLLAIGVWRLIILAFGKSVNLNTFTKILIGLVALMAIGFFLIIRFYNIVDSALINKVDSGSFMARTYSDITALGIWLQSYGLGVGLGSNRPSSFVTSLLSNLGLIGFALFALFVLLLIAAALRKKNVWLTSFVIGLIVYLFAKSLAGPDINDGLLWIFVMLIAAGTVTLPNANGSPPPIHLR